MKRKGILLLMVSLLTALTSLTVVYADGNDSERTGIETDNMQKPDEELGNDNDHESQGNQEKLEEGFNEGREGVSDLSTSDGADVGESTAVHNPLVKDVNTNETEIAHDNEKRPYGWNFNRTDKKWYFYNHQGKRQSGWLMWGDKWYYLDGRNAQFPGIMVSDCKMQIGRATYFFGIGGEMQIGWIRRPEGWYYADGSGAMLSGWHKVDSKWYYMDFTNKENPGLMVSDGEYKIGGQSYFFDRSGAMLVGWVYRPEGWYYTDGSGRKVSGWHKVGSKWYYMDFMNKENPGLMVSNGEHKIGSQSYFFDKSGAMLVGWVYRPEGWYYTDGSGRKVSGWYRIGGKWYYMDSANTKNAGLMASNGEYKIGGQSYFFDRSGAMLVGWVRRPEGWYYADESGRKVSGWYKLGGKWYYMDLKAEGKMASGGWTEVGNQRYFFNKDGSMAIGWLKLSDLWYYLDPSGDMVEGWQLINGEWYYFYYEKDDHKGSNDKWGSMAVNKVIDGWATQANGKAYKVESPEEKIKKIKTYIYVPYRYGGIDTKGWDCSGFTMWALGYMGVVIPRTSFLQAAYGTNVDKSDMSKWKPGDLLFYRQGTVVNHVALYLGDGIMMHALNSKYGTLIQDVEYYESWDSKNTLTSVKRYL